MQLGDKKLVVQRASVGASKIITGDGSDMASIIMSAAATTTNIPMPINIPGLQVYTCTYILTHSLTHSVFLMKDSNVLSHTQSVYYIIYI